EDRAELRRRYRRRCDIPALFVEPAGEFVDHPVGGGLGIAAACNRFKEVSGLALGGEDARVVRRQTMIPGGTSLLLVRQLRQLRLEVVNEGSGQLQRQ